MAMNGAGAGAAYNARTVEEVFRDFKGRRTGLIKALTTDAEEFHQQCDPEIFASRPQLLIGLDQVDENDDGSGALEIKDEVFGATLIGERGCLR
ncbi:hypothetical protein ACLB2K_056205 [Fragaria x ananassa]